MSPSYGVRWWVVCLVGLLSVASAGPSRGQAFEDSRLGFDLSPDPLARSPRLLGLGRLSLTVADPHNRINLWDFAGNPAGLFESDSISSLELRPGTGSASSVRDLAGGGLQRQIEAGGAYQVGYEAWRRENRTVYGAIGNVDVGRTDRPYSDEVEHRSISRRPDVMPVICGVMPHTSSGRARYAVRMITATQTIDDQYQIGRASCRERV